MKENFVISKPSEAKRKRNFFFLIYKEKQKQKILNMQERIINGTPN